MSNIPKNLYISTLKEPICEEKAEAVLGKIVARELAQEVLKKFQMLKVLRQNRYKSKAEAREMK